MINPKLSPVAKQTKKKKKKKGINEKEVEVGALRRELQLLTIIL